MDEHRRGDDHQRGEKVEGADPALDEARRAPTRAGDRCRNRVGAGDEGCEENERTECRHDCGPAVLVSRDHGDRAVAVRSASDARRAGSLVASYFDGHFAITPFGETSKPCGPELALQHDFGAILERVGDTPV